VCVCLCVRAYSAELGPFAKHSSRSVTLLVRSQTYHGLDLDTIDDELQRRALAVMIQTYGQVPRQLFKQPHPSSADSPADGLPTLTTQMSTLVSLTDFPKLEPDHLGESMMASRLTTGKNASSQVSSLAVLPMCHNAASSRCLPVCVSNKKVSAGFHSRHFYGATITATAFRALGVG